jgi:hypothetical protein
MPCQKCASEHQKEFQAEITLVFVNHAKINQPPVCMSQKTLLCLTCGYAELQVPLPQLKQLR